VRIGTFISSDSSAKLRRAIPENHSLVAVKSPAALTELVASGVCHMVMIDPLGVGDDSFKDLLNAVASNGLSLVIWTVLSEPTLSQILKASRAVPTKFLFRGVDDSDVGALQAILRLGATSSARALVLHGIAERVSALEHHIPGKCVALFGGNPIPESVEAFVRGTRWEARTVQRDFAEAGLCSPACLLQVARVARTWEPLQTETTTLDEVAKIAHCTSAKALAKHFASRIGLAPRQASRRMTLETFVARLVHDVAPPERR
jgi:hypothetical protein